MSVKGKGAEHLRSGGSASIDGMRLKLGPRPLNSGNPFAVQVSVGSRSLNVGADVLFHFGVLTLVSLSVFVYLQLLISLRATMIAMTTIRITRMIRR